MLEAHFAFELNGCLGRVELPNRPVGRAHRHPSAANNIGAVIHALDFFRFELDGILGNEEIGIGAAVHAKDTTHVAKEAAASAHIVGGFVRFEVLRFVIEADIARGGNLLGGVIVGNSVGENAQLLVGDFDIAFVDEQLAFETLLRGADFYEAAAQRKAGLGSGGTGGEKLCAEGHCGHTAPRPIAEFAHAQVRHTTPKLKSVARALPASNAPAI